MNQSSKLVEKSHKQGRIKKRKSPYYLPQNKLQYKSSKNLNELLNQNKVKTFQT